jgi:hypothetical protein
MTDEDGAQAIDRAARILVGLIESDELVSLASIIERTGLSKSTAARLLRSLERNGETLKLGFAVAPLPFDLRLEQSDDRTVAWRTESFPPHWVGTTIRWDVEPRDDGSTVNFGHDGFSDDGHAGHAAFTWGQIMMQLKQYAESGRPAPVFA